MEPPSWNLVIPTYGLRYREPIIFIFIHVSNDHHAWSYHFTIQWASSMTSATKLLTRLGLSNSFRHLTDCNKASGIYSKKYVSTLLLSHGPARQHLHHAKLKPLHSWLLTTSVPDHASELPMEWQLARRGCNELVSQSLKIEPGTQW